MWASVQTVRGCPKHCSFCSVWRTDGRSRVSAVPMRSIDEIVELRRRGFRFIALADDNFYTVTLTDIKMAARRADQSQRIYLEGLRAERFELMEKLAKLPGDMIFFTQITMEAAEDPAFLEAMRRARIKGALVGVEAVTPEGLEGRVQGLQLRRRNPGRAAAGFKKTGVHVLGSFIFGLPSDRPQTFEATSAIAHARGRDLRAVRDAHPLSRARSTSPPGKRAWSRTRPASPACRSRAIG